VGQKINPRGFRLGTLYNWNSRWFAGKKQYKNLLLEDVKLRRALTLKLRPAGISLVEIERSINKMDVTLHVSRPGIVIGRGGSGMEEIKKYVAGLLTTGKTAKEKETLSKLKLEVKVEPVKEPNLDAYLVAANIAEQLAKRLPQRRVANMAMEKVMMARAKGVKIILSGRIGGADISRRETYKTGSMPLSSIREDIDFEVYHSLTISGYVGVKVWICK
jgi:small subunit ribosomal protein S3